jgi:hypothetical protein
VFERAQQDAPAVLPTFRRPTLTKEQMFRLWRCAIKDDDALVDDMIREVYENIIAFDSRRAECVLELIIRRSVAANCALRSLLADMRPLGDEPAEFAAPPARLGS